MLTAGGALASSTPPTFAIPGFAARGLQVGGVSRLNDGGALIAGSLNDKARTADWHPVVVRLRLDGSVDLAYGSEGATTLRLGADIRATSLASDPQSANACIGLRTTRGQGVLVALNGQGVRRSRFGREGIVRLANAPVAVAWQPGELLVASGTGPCRGCRLTLVNPFTGSLIASSTLRPPASSGITACVGGSITSVVLSDPHTAQLAFDGAKPCITQLVTVAISTRGGQRSLQATATASLGAMGTAGLVSGFGSDTCVGASSPTSIEFGPFLRGSKGFALTRTQGGRLISLVALGHGACAALIADDRTSGGRVAQASLGLAQPTRDAVPRSVKPLGMFRCHAHLLVIGARGQDRARLGMIVAIPAREGPNAVTASLAPAGPASARCR